MVCSLTQCVPLCRCQPISMARGTEGRPSTVTWKFGSSVYVALFIDGLLRLDALESVVRLFLTTLTGKDKSRDPTMGARILTDTHTYTHATHTHHADISLSVSSFSQDERMGSEGWLACVQALRRQTGRIHTRAIYIGTVSYPTPERSRRAQQDFVPLCEHALPILLDRRQFPALTTLELAYIEPSSVSLILGMLANTGRNSSLNYLSIYSLPPESAWFDALERVLDSCTLRSLSLVLRQPSRGMLESVLAAPTLTRLRLSFFPRDDTEASAGSAEILSAFRSLAATTTTERPRCAITHLRLCTRGLSPEDSLWRCVSASPSVAVLTLQGSPECWLTPAHLQVLEDSLSERAFAGHPPLQHIIFTNLTNPEDRRELIETGVGEVQQLVARVSPSTRVSNESVYTRDASKGDVGSEQRALVFRLLGEGAETVVGTRERIY